MNPIVIDPPNFNQDAAWKECHDYVEDCGGLMHSDGEPNWKAAFGADPGCCGCPACHAMYWMWGNVQRCVKCGFEYPTNAWPMYAEGVNDAKRICGASMATDPEIQRRMVSFSRRRANERTSIYYRYGFEHPVDDAYAEFHRLDWRSIAANQPATVQGTNR